MAKIMEIIEKNPDYKKGTCSIKLLDTGFNQLTRKIGQKTDAKFITAKSGDPLSKELLEDLNKAQLIVRDKYKPLFDSYNTWVNLKKKIIPTLETFNYTFSSLVDYSKDIVPKETFADYYLLSKIIMAEKELYEAGKFWLVNSYKNNLGKMSEWSKARPYGSCVKAMMTQEAEARSTIYNIKIFHNGSEFGITHKRASTGSDKYMAEIIGLDKLPVGFVFNFKMSGQTASDAFVFITYSLVKKSLGTTEDDGYFDTFTHVSEGLHRVNFSSYVTQWTGSPSPHFNPQVKPSMGHIKSRVLI